MPEGAGLERRWDSAGWVLIRGFWWPGRAQSAGWVLIPAPRRLAKGLVASDWHHCAPMRPFSGAVREHRHQSCTIAALAATHVRRAPLSAAPLSLLHSPFRPIRGLCFPLTRSMQKAQPNGWAFRLLPGGVLRSQELALSVLSALEVLTVVFGMGTRVSPPP